MPHGMVIPFSSHVRAIQSSHMCVQDCETVMPESGLLETSQTGQLARGNIGADA